jgi:drug/metabolite transporter (DMT)-like permease
MNGAAIGKHRAELALLSIAFIWGASFVIVKDAVQAIPILTFLALRFGLALLALLLIFNSQLRGLGQSYQHHTLWGGALIGLALFGGYAFQTWGLLYTTATKSGFFTGLSVVLVPLFAGLFFRRRVSRPEWLAAGFSTMGLGLIVFGAGVAAIDFNLGDLLTLLAALCFALQIVLIDKLVSEANYPILLIAQIAVVALLSTVGALSTNQLTFDWSLPIWEAVVAMGFLATALAFWIQNRFQARSTATRVAIILASEPVFAGIFGYLLKGDRLQPGQWVGTALILTAMIVAQRR